MVGDSGLASIDSTVTAQQHPATWLQLPVTPGSEEEESRDLIHGHNDSKLTQIGKVSFKEVSSIRARIWASGGKPRTIGRPEVNKLIDSFISN